MHPHPQQRHLLEQRCSCCWAEAAWGWCCAFEGFLPDPQGAWLVESSLLLMALLQLPLPQQLRWLLVQPWRKFQGRQQ
jgi:hypothetical protein